MAFERHDCTECGAPIIGSNEKAIGTAMTVHLHDEHPEKFEEIAENARGMVEEAKELIDDA